MSWQNILRIEDLEKAWVTPASLGSRKLAVLDTPNGIRVVSGLCSHAGADLCEGYFTGHAIECPLHQGLFDAYTGAPLGAPVTRPLKVFSSRIEQGWVQIEV